MDILIIKLGAIGDVIRTTSFLPGIKKKYPNSNISWLTAENALPILEGNEYITKLSTIDDPRFKKKYDLIINLEDSKKVCNLLPHTERLFGPYIKDNKITYSKDSQEWFDMSLISMFGKEKADQLKQKNKKTYQKIIADALKIKTSKPIIKLKDKNIKFAQDFKKKHDIKEDDYIIGINTGAGRRWKYKSLNIEKTVELIKSIKKRFNAKTILFGGPEEEQRNKEIIKKTAIIDAGTGNTLLNFAALINLCNILITTDSLALHLATALDKKIIAFFGPTPASEIELYDNGIKLQPDMGCLACYKNDCSIKPNCMDNLKIDDFIKAIGRLR